MSKYKRLPDGMRRTNVDPRKADFRHRFGVSDGVVRHWPVGFIEQLERCADDRARRLLLGIKCADRKGRAA